MTWDVEQQGCLCPLPGLGLFPVLSQAEKSSQVSSFPTCLVPRGGPRKNNTLPVWPQVPRSPLKEFDKEKAWRAVVVQMAQ